jgi:membrane-associated protease RseP (regulator of RpoE activity)
LPGHFNLEGALVESLAVFVMLAILSVLIIVHEYGHFSVARVFGFQTPVFGFGLPFGPHWVLGRKWGTEFRIYAFLLGGFVAIPELGDETSATQDAFGIPLKAFRKFPIWQRALVAFAGVGFNILFAYLVMIVMFVSLGQPTQPTMVAELVSENPIAAHAGIKKGDEIVAIQHEKITSPTDAVKHLSIHKSEPVTISIKRDGQPTEFTLTTNADGKVGMALVLGPVAYQKVDGNFLEVAGAALIGLWNTGAGMLDALGQMVGGLFAGGQSSGAHPAVSIQDVHGILAVVKIGADVAKQDWSHLFLFTVLISLDLAIINLLPWPALDGGHLAFMAFEAIRGRPMEERAQGEIVKWGFVSLIILMAVIMVNDVTALFRGKLDLKSHKEESSQEDVSRANKPTSKLEDRGNSLGIGHPDNMKKDPNVTAPAAP